MKASSLFIYIICCIYRHTSIRIKPELKNNILKFGSGINYKYEGMLAHSLGRFDVITKFILPITSDVNPLKFNFKGGCEYLGKEVLDTIIEKKKVFLISMNIVGKKQYIDFYK